MITITVKFLFDLTFIMDSLGDVFRYLNEMQGLIDEQATLLMDYGCDDDVEEMRIRYKRKISDKFESAALKIIDKLKKDLARLKKQFREQELIEEEETHESGYEQSEEEEVSLKTALRPV